MITEEVGKVLPEVVSYENNGKDARGIDYARLTALLAEAVKQQQKQIQQQRSEIRIDISCAFCLGFPCLSLALLC